MIGIGVVEQAKMCWREKEEGTACIRNTDKEKLGGDYKQRGGLQVTREKMEASRSLWHLKNVGHENAAHRDYVGTGASRPSNLTAANILSFHC